MKILLRRIEKLESVAGLRHGIRVRFGTLRRLPQDYEGERHIEFAGWLSKPGEPEWVEYREVPGGPVEPRLHGPPEHMDIIFVPAYGTQRGTDKAPETSSGQWA